MNDELFAELMESVRRAGMPVREGGAILRGEKEPSRKFGRGSFRPKFWLTITKGLSRSFGIRDSGFVRNRFGIRK